MTRSLTAALLALAPASALACSLQGLTTWDHVYEIEAATPAETSVLEAIAGFAISSADTHHITLVNVRGDDAYVGFHLVTPEGERKRSYGVYMERRGESWTSICLPQAGAISHHSCTDWRKDTVNFEPAPANDWRVEGTFKGLLPELAMGAADALAEDADAVGVAAEAVTLYEGDYARVTWHYIDLRGEAVSPASELIMAYRHHSYRYVCDVTLTPEDCVNEDGTTLWTDAMPRP